MSLTMIEKPELQEEGAVLTPLRDEVPFAKMICRSVP
jgi:hypothetical protein